MQTFVSLRSANNLGIEFVYFNFSFLEYFHKHLLEHVNCPWIHLQVVEVSVYMVKILQSITRSLQIVKDIAIWPNLILVGLICCVFFQQFQPTGLLFTINLQLVLARVADGAILQPRFCQSPPGQLWLQL